VDNDNVRQLDLDDKPNQGPMEDNSFANRARLLDLDDNPQPKTEVIKKPVEKPIDTNPQDIMRALRDLEAAKASGHNLKDTVVPFGEPLNATGVENAARSKGDFDAMTPAVKAGETFRKAIAAEKREDHQIEARRLRLNEDGTLTRGNGPLRLMPKAFDGLCTILDIKGGASYLPNVPPKERARLMNELHFPLAYREDGRETTKVMADWEAECRKASRSGRKEPPRPGPEYTPRELTLRSRKSPDDNKREIYAVVGARYQPFNVDQVVGQIVDALPAGAKGCIKYDGYKATMDVLFHSNVPAKQYVVGEVFKAGCRFKMADDGTGSIQGQSIIWRDLCYNLMVLDVNKRQRFSRRHVGVGIADDVKAGIDQTFAAIEGFAKVWGQATVDDVLEAHGLQDEAAVFNGLVYNKTVWVPGCSAEDLVERLMLSWQKEPGHSKAAFVNAISRAAHEYEWQSPWATNDLEATAGELLYQTVTTWNVQVPESVEV
jgi:hypothetical protein